MKKLLLCALFSFFVSGIITAQDQAQIEANKNALPNVKMKSRSLQTGLLGFWYTHEGRMSATSVFRWEIGMSAALWGGIYEEVYSEIVLAPVIKLEPRWYYNLKKRVSQGKSIKHNSANFFSVSAGFHPNWFILASEDDVDGIFEIAIIPKWGIKRELSDNVVVELGAGYGYRYAFLDDSFEWQHNKGGGILDLHLRIGYAF